MRHRIRSHAALVKELPPEAAVPLAELLKREVRDLARLDARHLHPRLRRWLAFERIGYTASATTGVLLVPAWVLTLSGWDQTPPWRGALSWWMSMLAMAAGAVGWYAALKGRKLVGQRAREASAVTLELTERKRTAEAIRDVFARGDIKLDAAQQMKAALNQKVQRIQHR